MKRFSKTISLVLLVFTLIFALVGCATAKVDTSGIIIEDTISEETATTQEETTSSTEGTTSSTEGTTSSTEGTTSEVTASEEKVDEEVAVKYIPVENTYELFGYQLKVVADKGQATITYPASIITKSDIDTAAAAALAAYGSIYDLSNVKYDATQEGVLVVYYPEEWGVEEFAIAEQVLFAELPAYVQAVVASYATPAEEPVVEEELGFTRTINVFGYEATVEAYENLIEIKYPSFITYDEIKAAAAVAYQAYPQYLEGSTLYVDSAASTAVVTLAGVPSVEDFNYAVDIVEVALPAYVASLFVDKVDEVIETVDAVIEEVEETAKQINEEGLSASISLFGYEASITLKNDIITIDYPDFISVDEIKAAAAAAYQAYSQYLQGSELVIDDGFATLKLAFKIGEDEFNYAVNLLESELSYYIATVLGVTEETTEAVEEVVETVAEVVPELYETTLSLYGQEVQIVAYGNTVGFVYPEAITNAEVAAAAKAAYEAYSQYLDGSALTIDNGTAVLTLAYNLTEDDFNYAVSLLEDELSYYVASLFTEEAEEKVEDVVETVTEVAQAISEAVTKATEEAPAEQPAAEEQAPVVEEQPAAEAPATEAPATEAPATEAPATEAPAAEPAKTETTKPAETKTETTAPAATPAKKSNTGIIILIVVLVAVAAAAVVLFLKKKKN